MRSRPERPRLISTQRKDPLHEAFVACQPAQRAITTPTISPTPRYTMSGHNATLHVECRTAAHKNDLDPLKNVSTNRDMHTSLPHPLLPKLFRFNDTINSHPRPSHNALSPTQTPTLRTISQITIEDPSAFNRSNTADQIRRSFDALVKASPIALVRHIGHSFYNLYNIKSRSIITSSMHNSPHRLLIDLTSLLYSTTKTTRITMAIPRPYNMSTIQIPTVIHLIGKERKPVKIPTIQSRALPRVLYPKLQQFNRRKSRS